MRAKSIPYGVFARAFFFGGLAATSLATANSVTAVWAQTGEDKVAREELRESGGNDVRNSVWDGHGVRLFAARNETVSFNLVIEAAQDRASGLTVEFSRLEGPGGASIASRAITGAEGLADFRGRPIELFLVRYLPIRGASVLAYEHYDERLAPRRMRRPHDAAGNGRGGWVDRPDHDKSYPDIAVPIELESPFEIDAGTSQSVWVDVFVPKASAAGRYVGQLTVRQKGEAIREIEVELDVAPFGLPDASSAGAVMYVSTADINRRYLGEPYPHDYQDAELNRRSKGVIDRHFQLAKRHRVALFHEHTPLERVDRLWGDRLSGELFQADRGYEGPGEGLGNGVLAVGTYGQWPWRDGGREAMWRETDRWVEWLESQPWAEATQMFLYLADESDNFGQIEEWSRWVDENPGPGHRILTMATVAAPRAVEESPRLDVVVSTVRHGLPEQWARATQLLRGREKRFWLYNGGRPGSGCLATEDDGVALREIGWAQFKAQADRWFVWEGTYYNNYQGGAGETNVFRSGHTFGGKGKRDASLGETGWNYNNGDGVLFYPGTDTVFPDDSYGVNFPFASLRLKHWRRGLQDHQYLTLAAQRDPEAVRRLVEKRIPKSLWEVGVADRWDPTWVRCDISWSTDPDDWEASRRELRDLLAAPSAVQAEGSLPREKPRSW